MIGLIIWAILIIFIAEAASPGITLITLGVITAYAIIYFIAMAITDKLKNRK